MKGKITGLLAASTIVVLGVLGFAGAPALATTVPQPAPVTITDTPDDGCPGAWARDTITRSTQIKKVEQGKYLVSIKDEGTFETQQGAKSPGDSTKTIFHKVQGNMKGTGDFMVTGTLKSSFSGLQATYVNTTYACKDDLPAERKTGNWWKQYFEDGATAPAGIVNWNWHYATSCGEKRDENSNFAVGNILGYKCVTPVAPTLVQPTCKCADGVLTVPNVEGVKYNYQSKKVKAGKKIEVKAWPKQGYRFPKKTQDMWWFTVGVPPTLCPTPTGSPSPSGSTSPTASASPSTSSSPSASTSPSVSTSPSASDSPEPSLTPIVNGGGGGPDLPVTGASLPILVGGGAAVLAAGTALILIARKRRRATA